MFDDAIKMEKQSREIKKLKKQVREAQGELSIIKAIGNNSPEMKLLKKEVAALKQQLHTDREKAQVDLLTKDKNLLAFLVASFQLYPLATSGIVTFSKAVKSLSKLFC